MEGESKGRLQDLSDKQIGELVEGLNSLHEGELGISMLVACGERAVPALRDFLLHGKPSSIFVPRQRAVRALAELGAKDILVEYLAAEQSARDPVVAHGEEAVKNSAARALAKWQTDDVFWALLDVLKRHRLTGVIETLGEFARPEAVAELVLTLEDDFCRRFAEDALLKIGAAARPALIEAARTPDPSRRGERASSRNRRTSALRLLEHLQVTSEEWLKLTALLYELDAEIAARTAILALRSADEQEKTLAIRRLIEALPSADWLLQGEIESCLEQHFEIAHLLMDAEVRRRRINIMGPQNVDKISRLLLGIMNRAQRKAV